MAFVKLDTGILDSTLWIERDQREVFITALLMAEPREFQEPIEQIEIGQIKHTGYEAPPGWYGFVRAAGVGIINRAGVDRKKGMEALRKLGEPENESRSSEFDGRRMIRVNGGFVILNYMKYRDKDHTAAERQRRLRERRKNPNIVTRDVQSVTRDVALPSRNVTQADADADADTKQLASKPASDEQREIDIRFLQDMLAPVKGTRRDAKRWEAKAHAKLQGSPLDQEEVRWWTEHCIAEWRDPNQNVTKPIGYIIEKVTAELGDPDSAYRYELRRAEQLRKAEAQISTGQAEARAWESFVAVDPVLAKSKWQVIFGDLEKTVLNSSLETWFKPARPVDLRGTTLYMRVPSPEFQHLDVSEHIQAAVKRPNLDITDVKFIVRPDEIEEVR